MVLVILPQHVADSGETLSNTDIIADKYRQEAEKSSLPNLSFQYEWEHGARQGRKVLSMYPTFSSFARSAFASLLPGIENRRQPLSNAYALAFPNTI